MKPLPETTEPVSVDRMARLVSDLCALVNERSLAEAEITSQHVTLNRAAQADHQLSQRDLAKRHEQELAAAATEHTRIRQQIVVSSRAEHAAVESEYQSVKAGTSERFETRKAAEEQTREKARWEASTLLEAAEIGALGTLKESEQQITSLARELAVVRRQAEELLRRRRQWREYPEPRWNSEPCEGDPVAHFAQLASRAKEQLATMHGLSIPRLFEGAQPVGCFLLLCLVLVVPTVIAVSLAGWPWILLSGCAAVAVFVSVASWLYSVARRQSTETYLTLKRILAGADVLECQAQNAVRARYKERIAELSAECDRKLEQADAQYQTALADMTAQKQQELQQAADRYPARLAEIPLRRDRELAEAEASYSQRVCQLDQRYEQQKRRGAEEYAETVAENDRQYLQRWNELADRWQTGIQQFQAEINEVHRICDRWFPHFNQTDWQHRPPPKETPPAFRVGHYEVSLRQIEGGLPEDERLSPEQTEFQLPALLPFPQRSLLLIESAGEGRQQAGRLIQSVMLRMLTSMPPGRVQFTIVDPVGLGETFSAFMHLTDYEEKLIASRIWTDPGHIERRLTDLTDHMENVIQVYLRNEFETIQKYNEFAGEMAEPYRVLVVADFPTSFSETTAQKLKSIISSGARCGVFTVLSVDTRISLPPEINLAEFAPHALSLSWQDGQFVQQHADYGPLPLCFDEPPDADRFTQIVRAVGSQVQEAGRVEVPYECVVPAPDRWWTADSSEGLDVPLGRAGARKLQHLNLGKGTSHHVLIAGKTGSGKSNLMHALIVNLAMRYAPDEVELYLVDFKKGVEFKSYGSGKLPHARVVAIESEREFGLSVLARLDQELRRRGDLFRHSGVQDLAAYRARRPPGSQPRDTSRPTQETAPEHDAKLPRILLLIDEFQELFVEDDRLAQDAALYLDRLVRQGRAFGIHVLLGSQTLAGAYSLARSTIGQMAVRIALQCSEADAHLILSEENTAARLLTRPGEAIYNDANGLYEGNHPFQVVWLPDHQRHGYIERIASLATQRHIDVPRPIVFEGNAPADPRENTILADLLKENAWPESRAASLAWLGAPVAIKSHTAAEFTRQGGSNLLIVGHREEAGLGVLATSLIGLAAQHSPVARDNRSPGTRFYIFHGMPPEAAARRLWELLASALPHEIKIILPREAAAAVQEIAAELTRRRQTDQTDTPSLYLIVDHLGRFRDLRKTEEDFGFSSFSENSSPTPASQFAQIMRDGPELGIHSLIWCDTYNSVMRSMDRQGLRDLEMRVLFQISAADSSNLIDSPAAAQLGIYRALLYDDALGRIEKFRPYAIPSEEWIQQVGKQLHNRFAD
jgi:S-DNA-T family DNA segregation ATPase FtsK/SpoIIIE